MIKQVTMYSIVCDRCGKTFETDGCIAWTDKQSSIYYALASEWKWSDEKNRNVPICVKTEYVDGNNIKDDTWYKLKNGKFVEVNE